MAMPYQEAIEYLYGLQRFGIKLGLQNMVRLMEALGRPDQQFASILIAGTNGKGSTAALLASILKAAGYKVGLYTSPHLLDFNERILIDGLPLPQDEIARLIEEVRSAIQHAFPAVGRQQSGVSARQSQDLIPHTQDLPSPYPTFFEASTALAFLAFARKRVDYAVVEVGLGGRFDATNVLVPNVSVITNISLEHQEYLGNTLGEIAFEKAGIIKERGRVVTAAEAFEALAVIERVARERSALLFKVQEPFRCEVKRSDLEGQVFDLLGGEREYRDLMIRLLGRHQIVNAATAMAAVLLLQDSRISEEVIVRGLHDAKWPGRLQIVEREPFVILDGAHNPAGASTVAAFIQGCLPSRRIVLVFGVLKDKDWEGMLALLGPLASMVILTKPESDRAADPRDLASVDRYCPKLEIQLDVREALALAKEAADPDDVILVTGSLFTVASALKALGIGEVFGPD